MYPSRYNDSYAEKEKDDDTIIVKHDNITPNYQKIMDMLIDGDYEGIREILYLQEMDFIFRDLTYYAINHDDIEMFTILMETSKNVKFVFYPSHIYSILKNDKFKMFNIMMDVLNSRIILDIFEEIAVNKNIDIKYLILMIDRYAMPDKYVKMAINGNNINVIKYLISIGHDIQESIDSTAWRINRANIETLKLLTENNISIKKSTTSILKTAIANDDLDLIIYLLQCYPNYNINFILDSCISHNKISILKYLLQNGADIETVCDFAFGYNITVDTLKFLVGISYDILKLKKTLKKIFNIYFMRDSDLNNVKYLLEMGVSIKTLFKNEKDEIQGYTKKNIEQKNTKHILSPIEYIISINKIDHIKFLFENYYDTFKPHINRFFILACANGQIDIAKYLYALGVELCEKSLLCGCFFGHIDIIRMLLGWGMEFGGLTENPFLTCMAGQNIRDATSKPYENLIDGNKIFINHVYNYGDGYDNILKLLISYEVQISDDLYVIHLLKSDVEVVKYFLENDLDINLKFGIDGLMISLLEGALLCKNFKVVELLLDCGIEMHRMNDNVIKICNKYDYCDVKKLLLDYGYDFNL